MIEPPLTTLFALGTLQFPTFLPPHRFTTNVYIRNPPAASSPPIEKGYLLETPKKKKNSFTALFPFYFFKSKWCFSVSHDQKYVQRDAWSKWGSGNEESLKFYDLVAWSRLPGCKPSWTENRSVLLILLLSMKQRDHLRGSKNIGKKVNLLVPGIPALNLPLSSLWRFFVAVSR